MSDEDHFEDDISLIELEARLFPDGRSSLKDFGRLRATIEELCDQYGRERILPMIKELNSIKRTSARVDVETAVETLKQIFTSFRDGREK